MLELAYHFARHVHRNQKRKYTGEPYIVHPVEVAKILRRCGLGDNTVAAGYLHDVVEDTSVSLQALDMVFGWEVASFVEGVTTTPNLKEQGVNRAVRHSVEVKRMEHACHAVCNIRCADIIHNCSDIWEVAPDFAKIYIPEKIDILNVIKDNTDPKLIAIAKSVVLDKAHQNGI